MKYLVMGYDGPGFISPEETKNVLEDGILPLFKVLLQYEDQKKIVGGLPVGERTITFVLEAASNEEADNFLRDLPGWGALKWKVTALQSFEKRAEKDRNNLKLI